MDGRAKTKSSSGHARLESSHKQQDDQNEHNETKPAARVIAPVPAMRPAGQRTQEHQKQDYNQNRTKSFQFSLKKVKFKNRLTLFVAGGVLRN